MLIGKKCLNVNCVSGTLLEIHRNDADAVSSTDGGSRADIG